MFDDLSSLENSAEDTQKIPEAENEPSRWLSRWSHVFAGLAFCLLYFPFQSYPWSWYVAVAGSYSVFAFAIALGLGLDSADDFFGDPRVPKFVATLLLPHALILALITSAAYLWLRIGPTLPPWATGGRRLPLWSVCGLVVVYFAGTREGLWMADKIKRQFKERED
jgi:Na+/proline symporter